MNKEIFLWLKDGRKTKDVRKGSGRQGEFAYFLSGPYKLKLKILKRESGSLEELVRLDNYWRIIPSAGSLDEAIDYFRNLYGGCDGVFTSYYLIADSTTVNVRF